MRREGLCQWQTPVAPSGIAPATFRLVAQTLNQMRHRVKYGKHGQNSFTVLSRVCRTQGEVSLNFHARNCLQIGRNVAQVRLTFIDATKRTTASTATILTKLAITQRHYCTVFHPNRSRNTASAVLWRLLTLGQTSSTSAELVTPVGLSTGCVSWLLLLA